MVQPITLPKLGQMIDESTILRWLKQEGDHVAKGDILFEMETDKSVMEVESFLEGTLLKIVVSAGQPTPVMEVVGFIGNPGETIPESKPLPTAVANANSDVLLTDLAPGETLPTHIPEQKPPALDLEQLPAELPYVEQPRDPSSRHFKISPRAAKLARESVIDPFPIVGTGPAGRVVERDVKAYLDSRDHDRIRLTPAAKKRAAQEGIDVFTLKGTGDAGKIIVTDVERALAERPKVMSKMRQVIARRLLQSYLTTPHFFVTVAVDMTRLASFRAELKAQEMPYSLNDFILKAVALTLRDYPTVNSTTDGKHVQWHSKVHLGLAVSVEEGLLVPVIRGADELTLEEIHSCATELVAKARTGKLTPDEMSGSTFTVSNMGMLEVENFTAIINPGESAVLAVSSLVQKPVVRNNQVVIGKIMKITLSADHRIIDGALAAEFTNAIKNRLEQITLWKHLV